MSGANYAVLLREAELSDQFFNSPEAEELDSFDFWEALAAARRFKSRVYHPWADEQLAKDFMKRL